MNRTRQIRLNNGFAIGGGADVSVQTMTNVDPHDVAALVAQVTSCAERGADLIRLTVPDLEAAKAFGEVRRRSPVPLVADIHFDYLCALAAIENGADALRINPGNIGSRERVQAVARSAKAKGVAIRIGVNSGSLEKGETPVSSALKHVKLLEDEDFHDIVISAKASNVKDTITIYRELAERTDYPLHLGVTEAGTLIPGAVRSSVAMGVLLSEGIGDTIRVSLTAKPEKEVKVALEILRSLGLRGPGPSVTSCPTCGRTKVDLQRIAVQVEDALETLRLKHYPRVAVMGCAVNGPGEAKDADIALCGGEREFLLYIKGKMVSKVAEAEAVGKVVEYALSL